MVARFDEAGDGEVLQHHAGGERPVTGLRGVPYSFGEIPVAQVPAAGATVQISYLSGEFVTELQAQHLSQQRVVAIPAAAQRLNESVRLGQRGQLVRLLRADIA